MSPSTPQTALSWIGRGSTSIPPPAAYWAFLKYLLPGRQLTALQGLSGQRLGEFRAQDLPPPREGAEELLERVAADGWLLREERWSCPSCATPLDEAVAAAEEVCPECGEAFVQHGGLQPEVVYTRRLAPPRSVEWVVAIHGMNTSGAWQEELSWLLATTWGRSVPVAVYKYGIVIMGVLLAWRRRKLRNDFRAKLAKLGEQARAHGYPGKPDVIAHSFGTWLFGHVLEAELDRPPEERLRFGRVILTGCVLRPNLDWARLQEAGLVEEVLNHYGSKDAVVPFAHATIWDSGPSGRRGFDGDQVLNVRAEGYGHSDLFDVEKWVVAGKPFNPTPGEGRGASHLVHAYERVWRPFLTLPATELASLPDRDDPPAPWRSAPWMFRGTLFPFVALPLLLLLVGWLFVFAGGFLWEVPRLPGILLRAAAACGTGLGVLALGTGLFALFRRG